MSEEASNADLAERTRSLWDAANRRDGDAIMRFFAPEPVWETTLAVLDGPAAIRERLDEWFGAFDELEFVLEEILDFGNGVTLTVVNQKARPAGGTSLSSSGHIERREVYLAVWRDGMITRSKRSGHCAMER